MSLQQIQQTIPVLEPTATHEIVVLDPKPAPDHVRKLVLDYFDKNADSYDDADERNPKRRKYTDTVNRLVAGFLGQEKDICNVLSIAAGTGRREAAIRNMLTERVKFTCTDLSSEMCRLAAERGHNVVCGPWHNIDLGKSIYDSVLFLYSFGQLPDQNERLAALKKINKHLRHSGSLYLDVFNLEDDDEWGPELDRRYQMENWERKGYERGDVFYRKVGGQDVSYCHYFTRQEMENLLRAAGMRISRILHIGYGEAAGTVMPTNRRGAMLIRATKAADA